MAADFQISAQQFTSRYLGLVSSGEVAVITVPEMALFCSGLKPALRLYGDGAKIASALADTVKYIGRKKARSSHVGGSWSDLLPADDAVDITDDIADVVVLANDKTLGEAILNAELKSTQTSGALLGYPPCCVAAVETLAHHGGGWPRALVCRTTGSPSAKANRLAADWGGISPIGELFPCTLNCDAAMKIGEKSLQALFGLGLGRLADRMHADATVPICIDPEGRAIRTASTDPLAVKFVW